jgi:hypothetical protein
MKPLSILADLLSFLRKKLAPVRSYLPNQAFDLVKNPE